VPLLAAKKREMDDNSKKIGQLLWRLNAGEVSQGVLPKLLQLCQAIDSADWHTANHIQVGRLSLQLTAFYISMQSNRAFLQS